MREKRNAYKFWVEKPKRRSPGIPRRRWENNIKMDLQEIGWSGMGWIHLAKNGDQCGFL
jgi:hypothetical protein